MPVNWLESGLSALFGANNPDAFASYAAAKGIEPPADGTLGAGAPDASSLAGLLEPSPMGPLAGIQAPPQVAAQLPSTPSAPQPSQAIDPQVALMKLLMASQQPQAPVPSLAGLLGK